MRERGGEMRGKGGKEGEEGKARNLPFSSYYVFLFPPLIEE